MDSIERSKLNSLYSTIHMHIQMHRTHNMQRNRKLHQKEFQPNSVLPGLVFLFLISDHISALPSTTYY